MTWAEIEIACKGYEIRLARAREIPRFIATAFINANRKKGASAITPQDFMPLITDKKVVRLMTKEEYEAIQREREKIIWQQRN